MDDDLSRQSLAVRRAIIIAAFPYVFAMLVVDTIIVAASYLIAETTTEASSIRALWKRKPGE